MPDQYSINIADLTKDAILGPILIAPVTPNRTIIDAEPGRMDGMAILLECDEERAKAIIDVIRIKHEKHDIRCYKNNERI